MLTIAYIFSSLCLILNVSLFVRLRPPQCFYFVMPQIAAAALSPFLVLLSLAGAGLGWLAQGPFALAVGLLGTVISVAYIALVIIPRGDFARAFGKNWQDRISPVQGSRMLKGRWGVGLPKTGEPGWERDLPFWTIPGETSAGKCIDRKLLCDIWQPPEGVARSGLAIIYFHGSGWWILDKDLGTRPLFRQLTAQGHVIMDVAYRLCPEVDIYGMIGDVKRAVSWMKANAAHYSVNPDRVVLAGASAGGHLGLLAAYAPDHPRFTPSDVQNSDLSVRAVVSFYGPTDLRECYLHTNQARLTGLPNVEIGLPGAATMKKDLTNAGRLDTLLGGHLQEVPDVYELASPVAHVHPGCPPTLLVQGRSDIITPAASTQAMYTKLVASGVPAINIIYPLTNHAFDLLLPQVSPPAYASLYDLERFLALMV
jgi:acetyl esterase/lipase